MTKKGEQLKFLSTQVGGSKLMNLYVAFECAFHIFELHSTSIKFQYPCLCDVC